MSELLISCLAGLAAFVIAASVKKSKETQFGGGPQYNGAEWIYFKRKGPSVQDVIDDLDTLVNYMDKPMDQNIYNKIVDYSNPINLRPAIPTPSTVNINVIQYIEGIVKSKHPIPDRDKYIANFIITFINNKLLTDLEINILKNIVNEDKDKNWQNIYNAISPITKYVEKLIKLFPKQYKEDFHKNELQLNKFRQLIAYVELNHVTRELNKDMKKNDNKYQECKEYIQTIDNADIKQRNDVREWAKKIATTWTDRTIMV